MLALVLGVIVLILLLFAAYSFSKADAKQAARVLRYVGAGTALLFAAFLLVPRSNRAGGFDWADWARAARLCFTGGQALAGALRKAQDRSPVCVQRFWKWNSSTTAAPCAVRF